MDDRRIVIVGFMGSGKTTVARALSRELNCEMIDLDSIITESQRRSPAAIIQEEGETFFREIETLLLREVLQNRTVRVIALGGGTWTIPANRTLIALHDCWTIWLDAPFELCWQRITAGGDTVRPLAPNRADAMKLYESRSRDYSLVHLRQVIGYGDSAEVVAEQILTQT